MCRLVLMNKNGEKEIEKSYGLTNYLTYLEDSYGGHGNGVALLRNGKVIYLEKGVNLTVKEISRVIRKRKYDWCIFHTRLASVGSKSNENCHPFMIGNEVMAMNGTERSEILLTNAKDITDTEAILSVKEKFNLEVPVLSHLNSIFIGFSKGNPYLVANNTHNIKLMHKKKDNAIVFASEFPDKLKKNIYDAKEPFIWQNEEINMQNFKKHKKEKQIKFKQTTFEELPAFNEEDYYIDLYDFYYRKQFEDENVLDEIENEEVKINAA